MTNTLAVIFLLLVLMGMVPTCASFAQFLLVGLHGIWNHYSRIGPGTPRVAFVLPAWNEADVLGPSIDALMRIDYPAGSWRLYIVDDASTDHTPEVMHAKVAQYPGSVFHLRRERGGEGKAHTLNHGLQVILADDWAEAIMIMDADVLFEAMTLRRMVRHLADPEVGGVTAYVKEGSHPGGLLSRFIGFEYIVAQAAARRTQNVMGGLACMAGGAQLHSRANLIAIGGEIDTSTLAEDTYTTFQTQLLGHRVLIEPNAVVWAEEPDSLAAFWRQRLRWGRGNLQIMRAFSDIWFKPGRSALLGNWAFGILWFSITLMPFFMFAGSIGVIGLYHLWTPWALEAFYVASGVTLVAHLFQTMFSFAIDPTAARRSWFEGIAFPGLISIGVMTIALLMPFVGVAKLEKPGAWSWGNLLVHAILGWSAISIAAAWCVYRMDKAGAPKWLRNAMLVLVGYGPMLGAIALAAIVAEIRKADLKWDKTIKTGKVRIPTKERPSTYSIH